VPANGLIALIDWPGGGDERSPHAFKNNEEAPRLAAAVRKFRREDMPQAAARCISMQS
jgi:hypothetical protein